MIATLLCEGPLKNSGIRPTGVSLHENPNARRLLTVRCRFAVTEPLTGNTFCVAPLTLNDAGKIALGKLDEGGSLDYDTQKKLVPCIHAQ